MLPYVEPRQTISVLDIACGGGDVLCGLAVRAHRQQFPFLGVGYDISRTACDFARGAANERLTGMPHIEVTFEKRDCLLEPLPCCFDVVYSSLFLHHLDEIDAERLLIRMKHVSRKLVLVDDLIRSSTGLVLAWLATRLLSRSHVVHVDGPLSVRAAFTKAEVRAIAEQAGLISATIQTHWPWRFLLTWTHPQ